MVCTQDHLGGAALQFPAAPLFLSVFMSCITLCLALTSSSTPDICGTGVT